jgi:hypothetical protein
MAKNPGAICFEEGLVARAAQRLLTVYVEQLSLLPVPNFSWSNYHLESGFFALISTIHMEQLHHMKHFLFSPILAPPQCSLRGPVGDGRGRFVVTPTHPHPPEATLPVRVK